MKSKSPASEVDQPKRPSMGCDRAAINLVGAYGMVMGVSDHDILVNLRRVMVLKAPEGALWNQAGYPNPQWTNIKDLALVEPAFAASIVEYSKTDIVVRNITNLLKRGEYGNLQTV